MNRRKTIDIASNQFYKFEKWLLFEESLKKLSSTAKILYMLMKDREQLSLVNAHKFTDNEGYLFQYFDQEKAAKTLGISLTATKKAFKDLVDYKLIDSVRQGLGKPNRIYILNYPITKNTLDKLSFENKSNNDLLSNETNKNSKLKIESNKTIRVRSNKHNDTVNNTFTCYTENELEQLLLNNQRKKSVDTAISTPPANNSNIDNNLNDKSNIASFTPMFKIK